MSRRWPVALTYGLTEATSQVATAPPEQVRSKLGTVGAPLPGVGVAVRTGGAGAGRDGEGEILVRGPTVAPLPPRPQVDEVAASAHGGTRSVHVDSAGWLHTGDLGRLDGDGDLWITGRLSDRIVSGGVTVDPAEVEEVLREHPGVEEAAVVGLPDPEWGELVAAAVVPRSGRASLATDDVAAFVKERLGSAKRPRRIAVVAALPRNPNGKVDRGEVRRLMDRK